VIVVDTSVWIAAARKPEGREATTLKRLIDADEVALAVPVRMELMAGVSRKDRPAFARALTALPVLFPSADTWALAESWIAPASHAGHHFAVSDLLVAAAAAEVGGLVWSLDDDFQRLERLGFVQVYVNPAGP
jgi:predicted nucleic acid-binding protein